MTVRFLTEGKAPEVDLGSCIYVIENPENGWQKVGMTANLPVRFKSLEAKIGGNLSLQAAAPVLRELMRIVERRAHNILCNYRTTGEWFDVTTEQAIEAVNIAIEELNAFRSEPDTGVMPRRGRADTPKSTAQRVREAEAFHRARGEKALRVWVPDNPDAIRQVRELAARLCASNLKAQ